MTGLICGRKPIRFTVLFHAMIQKNGPCSSIPTHPLCESLELLKYNVKNIAFVSAIRCPFCTKPFPGGRIEDHLLSCLTSPPLPYNSKLPISSITVRPSFSPAYKQSLHSDSFCFLFCTTADVLAKDSGECSICLEDLLQGETTARLACLCVYHKR